MLKEVFEEEMVSNFPPLDFSSYRFILSQMTADNRVGVWVERGKVYRRDSDKDYSARVYIPRSPNLLPQVVEKARSLQSDATMDSWTASMETAHNDTVEELKKLIKP